ncbi:MAG: PDDEXK nuclease domain-containing protein [Bacteroidota bacterium]|nr:PDDEXK nuclease domain-containing protein [Bacteroidota bacterium]
MNIKKQNIEYIEWLDRLKTRIRKTQIKAVLSANTELLQLYWDIGKDLFEKKENQGWGNSIVENLSKDLKSEFPNMQGFSRRNLFYMRSFYTFYKSDFEKVQRFVAQIPWGHNIKIISKSDNINEALFYLSETVENGWSRDVLDLQIKNHLFKRQGKAITNFSESLPKPNSDLANQTLKDPYLFDFLTLSKDANEKNIEDQLTKHITKFLLELGKGFAFIGRQYHLEVGEKDFFIDLLFYHTKLRCYVVVELKATGFKPEYAGKLNFYLSAVDSTLKTDNDNTTIGILLCKERDKIEAEYSLRGISQPIGIAEYKLSRAIPKNIKSELPTIEEIELATTKAIRNAGYSDE